MDITKPMPRSVVMVRKQHNQLRSTVYAEAQRAITRLGIDDSEFTMTLSPMRITCKATGNSIFFVGSDSPDDTKGIIDKNRPFGSCIVDEVSDFFRGGRAGEDELQNIEATFLRGAAPGFQTMYAFNPPKNPNAGVNAWAEKMSKRPDVIRTHVTYLDVPPEWLGQGLLRSAAMLKQFDERQYRWLWLGEAIGVDDLIYYMYDPDKHVRDPLFQAYGQIYVGVDYGQMNATTFQAFGLNNVLHSLDGLDEYYHSGRDGRQRSPSDYGQDLAKFITRLHEQYKCSFFHVYIDPSAKGLAEEAKRATRSLEGVTVVIKDAQNDVAKGIGRVQLLLSLQRISFSPSQSHVDEEITRYEYDPNSVERGSEKPIKTNDHAMDAIRYTVMGAWSKLKPFLPKTEKEDAA